MPDPPQKLREAPPYGLHPQFRQVYGESFCAGTEGGLLRIGVGSVVPEMSDGGTARRVVTDFELLIAPSGGEYLLAIISKWLEKVRSTSGAPSVPKKKRS
jgi:hypothetical protein